MIGDKWLHIRNDKKKGLSYSEIAHKYNIDRRTAKKYCESNVKPDYKYSNPRKRKDVNGEEKKLYCFLMILGYSRMR